MQALTARLAAIAGRIPPGATVADIGTDHGLLPIALVTSGRCEHAIACDIREKPLAAARRNVAAAGLTENIELRLGDGLAALKAEEADCIVIAGMGGDVIAGILARAPWVQDRRYRLLLQPMTSAEVLRRYLCEAGFQIESESAVFDRGRYYTVLSAIFAGNAAPCDELFAFCGRLDPKRNEDRAYLQKVRKRLEDCARDLENAPGREAVASTYDSLARRVAALLEG